MADQLTISTLGFERDRLRGETAVVTGAGGGIGYEAARALLWLGANVVVAEIDIASGSQAAQRLNAEFDGERALFVQTDVGDEASVQNLYAESARRFGKVDVVINNATIAVLGTVTEVPIAEWDASYRVNLRGPVLMARAFLPDMIGRQHGTFLCVSSTGTAFLGAYETFKAAQVHLATTLDAELEGAGVVAFTIAPGLVPTETASRAVAQLAPLMGMTVDEFFALNKNVLLTPEEAGAGFATAVVLAEQFRGMEISSLQALKAANINFGADDTEDDSLTIPAGQREQAAVLCAQVHATLKQQADGWKQRSLFERQWVIRDFKKTAGMSVEEWLAALAGLESGLRRGEDIPRLPLEKLAGYYTHLAELAKGYEKNAAKLEENLRYVYSWRDEVVALSDLL
ncbi:MAG: SDR family NAD(P)-dependent oxidoreductase [Anaerolineae bacterium]|nr:SDR family NAD(P)-dependent oxidoreductase [Anaerolineae bacterium]